MYKVKGIIYKALQCAVFCSLLSLTLTLIVPTTLYSVLFSNSLTLFSSCGVGDEVSHLPKAVDIYYHFMYFNVYVFRPKRAHSVPNALPLFPNI
jgi:hypothetical protein